LNSEYLKNGLRIILDMLAVIPTMKIGMMAAWNQTSGVSIHAELVGRGWVEQGHPLRVFSFIEKDYHGRSLVGQDEDYVTRCFGTGKLTNFLDPTPFLENEYEIFVAQDIGMVPMDKLQKIFHIIKRKGKTIHVVHDSELSEDTSFYQHDWDALVCFDIRFKNMLTRVYPEEMIHIIPFPCTGWDPRDKEEARRQLSLPLDAKIILIFGQKWRHLQKEEIQVISELNDEYNLLVIIISESQRITGLDPSWCNYNFKKEVLERDELYKYLHASDTWLYPKRPTNNHAVLSSTLHFALGSGCIATARESNFLYGIQDAVLHYTNQEEFRRCLVEAFEQGDEWRKAREAAKRCSEERESGRIAKMFIELFQTI
jgi:sulfur relay (sulfurtransferase) DsrF/TusC family protein